MASNSAGMLLRRGSVRGVLADIRIEGDRIVAIGHHLERHPGEPEIDADGGAILPGLHDHHLHLRAAAAAAASVPLGPPEVTSAAQFAAALRKAVDEAQGRWIRGVGYHDSVAGRLEKLAIDRIVPQCPVRIQHRSGSLWILNTTGLGIVGAEREKSAGIERDEHGRPTGRLWRMDGWLRSRLATAGPKLGDSQADGSASLARLSAAALARGVTGWTDATPGRTEQDALDLAAAVEAGQIAQRLHLMAPADVSVQAVRNITAVAGVTIGPVKLLLDDWELPGIERLAGTIAVAHARQRPVAIHCVTPAQIVVATAALDLAGALAGDRIEHGALIPAALLPRLAALGVTVVTQPAFVYERGDQYLADVPPDEIADLWRARSLIEAGIPVAAGTDAPFGPADPWGGVRAAAQRTTASGRPLGRQEAVSPQAALRWWTGRAPAPTSYRTIAPGQPADIVVLGAPLAELLRGTGTVPVTATLVGGHLAG
jgi:predicted amidohydrolase YtcJ